MHIKPDIATINFACFNHVMKLRRQKINLNQLPTPKTAGDLRLLSPQEIYQADKWAINHGVSGIELMERAGTAIVKAILARFSPVKTVIVAGPGNNGGDGFVVARQLRNLGWPVTVSMITNPAKLHGDAKYMADLWGGEIAEASADMLHNCGLIIDGLFGAGLSKPIDNNLAPLITAINAAPAIRLSIDVPSGIDGNSGHVKNCAVKADLTVTFFRQKPGHLLAPGREYCGPVICSDIGISDQALTLFEGNSPLYHNHPLLWQHFLPRLQSAGHKYHRGHVLVVGGPAGKSSAARLAAFASLKTAAGLVTIASPKSAMAENAAHLNAVMLQQAENAADISAILADNRYKAALIGPAASLSHQTSNKLRALLASDKPCVLDADALRLIAGDPTFFDSIKHRSHAVILTPHEGEFTALFPDIAKRDVAKTEKARQAATSSGAIIVYKGSDTVIAAPDGRAIINDNAPPYLATAGSGDVLAGMICGLLATGMAGLEAAACAVWHHGFAAQRAGAGLTADELADYIAIYTLE